MVIMSRDVPPIYSPIVSGIIVHLFNSSPRAVIKNILVSVHFCLDIVYVNIPGIWK